MMSNRPYNNEMLLWVSIDCHKDDFPTGLLPTTIQKIDANLELLFEGAHRRLLSGNDQLGLVQTDILILFVSDKYVSSMSPSKLEELRLFSLDKRLLYALLEPCEVENSFLSDFDMIADVDETRQIISENILPEKVERKLLSVFEICRNSTANHTIKTARQNEEAVLRLNNLGLKYLPFDLLFMPYLTELYVADNVIERLTFLDNLSLLKILDCNKNKISRIDNLESLLNLEKLDLFNNEVEKIEGLDSCTKLSFLGLSNNRLRVVSNIGHLSQLKSLYVEHNYLHFVYENKKFNAQKSEEDLQPINAFDKLPKDIRLVITSNPIVSIRPLLGLIKSNAQVINEYSFDETKPGIFIKDCLSILEPSLETVYQGNDAIINYFEEIDAKNIETTKLEIVKLVLIGNSRCGKTNFCEYLMTGSISEYSISTHLLNIKNFKAPFLLSPAGNPTLVNIFDFGGQDYYHDAHKIFYSHDTAYILLWDKKSNSYNEKTEYVNAGELVTYEDYPLEYWLESVKYRVGSRSFENYYQRSREKDNAISVGIQEVAPILVLQNKIDEGEGWLDQNKLESLYPNIKGFFNISLKNNKRTKILEEVLSDFFYALNLSARQLRSYENELILSISATAAEKELEILTIEEFHRQCKMFMDKHYPQIEFTVSHATIIAQILNNIGLYLFDREAALVYTNIIELNKQIKDIMQIAKLGNDKGFFRREQLQQSPFLDKILNLLCKNNSIVSVSTNLFVAPQFLPLKPDDSIAFFLKTFSHTNVRYFFKTYFHKSLLLDLFAKYLPKANTDLTDPALRYLPFWRNGIIIKKENSEDMVFVEFEKKAETGGVVYIRTMKPFNRLGLEGEIDKELQNICNGWTYERELSTNSRQYFSHSDLMKYNTERQFVFKKDMVSFNLAGFRNIEYFENTPKRMFVSYSSKDGEFVTRFFVHLKSLQDNRKISPWYDRMIAPGTKWDDAIQEELTNADMIVFLLSPDFLATEYIMKVELPQSIKLADEKGTRLMFIQLKSCLLKEHEIINRFQQTSDSRLVEKKILEIGQPDNDEEWVNIVGIILKELNPTK